MFKKTKLLALFASASFALIANAAEETKPFSEWVKILWEEQNAFYKSHPDLIDIEKGASIALPAKINTTIKKGLLTPLGKKWVKAYTDFINGKGKAMLENWKANGKLNPENEAYKYVIQATATEKKCCTPNDPIAKLFVKGYLHKKFTRAEIDKMRYFLAATTKKHSGMKYDFRNLKWGGVDWKKKLTQIYPLHQGEKVKDFACYSFDKIIEKEGFSKVKEWHKYETHGFLTPKYLERYSLSFNGYRKVENDKLEPILDYGIEGDEDISISLKEMKDGVKPTLIFSHGASDTFDFYYDMVQWNSLYPIYKDKINFYYFASREISQDYIGGNYNSFNLESPIKDSVINSCSYFGIKRIPFSILNNVIMNNPYFYNIKAICDNLAGTLTRTYFINSYHFFLIDTDGINCGPAKNGRQAFEAFISPMQHGRKRLKIEASVPKNGYAWLYWISLNAKIRLFKIMERLDWKYSAEDTELTEFYKTYGKTGLSEFGRFNIKKGIVKEITADKIVINGADDFKKKDIIDHTLLISDRTRVGFEGGGTKKYGATIKDIKVGDKISAVYRYLNDEKVKKKAIVLFRYENGNVGYGRRFLINAKVSSIDIEKGVIKVQALKPNKEEWIGYKYWDKMIAEGAAEPSGSDGVNYHFGRKLLNGTDEDRAFELVIDSGVDFSIDGINIIKPDLTKVKAGDNVIFSFLKDYGMNKIMYPENVYIIKPIKK